MTRLHQKQQLKLEPQEIARLRELQIFECEARKAGYSQIAGIDEAGRGPLAGPVVAACCLISDDFLLPGVNDSKKISPKKRKDLFQALTSHSSITYGVGIVTAEEIDRINIYQATIVAMQQAVSNLSLKPDFLLVDGMELKNYPIPSLKIIKGDSKSYLIAAASIIAKETRDLMMQEYHNKWPEYGFDRHKGYGTKVHREAIEKYGPCEIHRKTFEPVASLFTTNYQLNLI